MRRMLYLAAVLLGMTATAAADDHVVTQQHKAFSVSTLRVKVGDTITFINYDPYVHNIFSLSDVQSFDLGSFGKGGIRKVTLTSPGKIEVECAVHPEMKLTIDVVK